MKKIYRPLRRATLLTLVAASLTSCATLFGGRITEHQKAKPAPGEPARELRIGAFVADLLLFWPSLAVDFATGAIYKPLPKTSAAKAPATQTQTVASKPVKK